MSQRKLLLLADDSITIQKVVNLTFADEGIEVVTVGDGDSAMKKISKITPDLVMADVNMPGLNGYELCEKIRESENLKKTPVILLVGSFEPFDEEKARSVGANDFLTKPFQSIRQLVSKVSDLLDASENGEVETPNNELENASTLRDFSASSEEDYSAEDSSTQENFQPYGDAGMDDEMIQADNGETYSFDESSKYESKVVDEPEYSGKTQPLSAEDLQNLQFSHSSEENVSPDEVSQESSVEQETTVQTETEQSESTTSETASLFDFSDDNLLEIPFEEFEEENLEQAESASATPAEQQPEVQAANEETQSEPTSAEIEQTADAYQQTAPETFQTETESANTASQLSPEMIEAIAQRVVEKLSDKAVKDVAWEVVPEMADLIIKKMAEEKLKE